MQYYETNLTILILSLNLKSRNLFWAPTTFVTWIKHHEPGAHEITLV